MEDIDIYSLINSENLPQSEDFYQKLFVAVESLLLRSSKAELMQAFYRLDLSEKNINLAFSCNDKNRRIEILTRAIIDRLIQKQKTRSRSHL